MKQASSSILARGLQDGSHAILAHQRAGRLARLEAQWAASRPSDGTASGKSLSLGAAGEILNDSFRHVSSIHVVSNALIGDWSIERMVTPKGYGSWPNRSRRCFGAILTDRKIALRLIIIKCHYFVD